MKVIIIALIIFFSSCSKKDEMRQYLKKTRSLIKDGKNKEALERCIWFHDNVLKHRPSMAGVRLSFALSDWKKLGEVYPPALDSLVSIRNRKTNQLINKDAPSDYFSDISAINRTLGEGEKTIELFEKLTKLQPNNSYKYWIYTKAPLFAAKRYDIIKNYIGNPLREFSIMVENYDRDTLMYKKLKLGGAHFKAYNEDSFVKQCLQLIEFAMALNDKKSAIEIQQKALKIVEDYRLRDAIARK